MCPSIGGREVPVDVSSLRVCLQPQKVNATREPRCHNFITSELDVRHSVAVRRIGLINTLKTTSRALPKLEPAIGATDDNQIVDEVKRPDGRCVV